MKADGKVQGTNITSRETWRKHLLGDTGEGGDFSRGGGGQKGQLEGW